MSKNNWRNHLNKELKHYMEKLILESFSHRPALELAPDKGRAQLWVALAILNKRLSDTELKTEYLERALQQFFPKKKLSETERKKIENEAERFIKSLVRGEIKKREKSNRNKTKRAVSNKPKKQKKLKRKVKSSIKIAKSL
ncbi:MAG: hypothetical protein N3G19_01065 [Candidatus Pacearchaeota archaeon]|nr:hypothetical protein [Candidatus Pacearchaeota archaeon]